jgi:hypothetical protein
MAQKVVKVKASRRNGKVVKAHTRVVKGGSSRISWEKSQRAKRK